MPAILKAPAPLAVEQWKQVFNMGRAIGPILALLSSGCFAFVGYKRMSSTSHTFRSQPSFPPRTFQLILI
jgi:hypothetical protein